MPLINIDVLRGRDSAQLRTLLDTVHASMVEAFEVPDTDRYQILTQHDPEEMVVLDTGLGFERSRDVVVLRFISKPRSPEAKQRLYALLAERLEAECGLAPEDLVVALVINGDADWSFGAGRAQFVAGDL